jgi:hypothetical protein
MECRALGNYWREVCNVTNYNEKMAIDRSYWRNGDKYIEKQALGWIPQEARKRGRPKQIWKMTVLEYVENVKKHGRRLGGWKTTE